MPFTCDVELGDERVHLTGTADRVERDPDGRVRIVDFKTSRAAPAAADVALQDQLGKARTQEARRRYERAVTELRTFITLVGRQSAEQAVKDVLVRDANALITRLGGTTAAKGGPSRDGLARLPRDPDRRKV